MTTKISQWHRIALLAAGIATSMVSMAWGQDLYQTHTDGSIWQYTGIPCSGGSCTGWLELDNNPNLKMIAAGGGALFEMHNDGSIWWYIGPACSGGTCPGWVELDNNPDNAAIGVGGSTPYEMHGDGSLWEYNGVICNGGFCPGWTELSAPGYGQFPIALFVGANASLVVYSNSDFYGEILSLFGAQNNWAQIDETVVSFAVGANTLYDVRGGRTSDGRYYEAIRQYTGSPITYNWQTIDYIEAGNGPNSSIAAGGGLYEQRPDNSIWQYTGTPCNGATCSGWVKIENHKDSLGPVAGSGSNAVYQMRATDQAAVSIWQYNGTPCSGTVCSGWAPLDNNPNTTSIVAGPVPFGFSVSDGPVTFAGRSNRPAR
jgi:hypothetical protein